MTKTRTRASLPIIGWREWLALPALGVSLIKAKIDTGARTSSLHAFDVKTFQRDGKRFVRFTIHPHQRDARQSAVAEAELIEYRKIRSSSGHESRRPVILTPVEVLGQRWLIELTLTSRDEMGFRMLLGRQGVRDRFLVDPGRSYYGGEPGRKPRKKKQPGNKTSLTKKPSPTNLEATDRSNG